MSRRTSAILALILLSIIGFFLWRSGASPDRDTSGMVKRSPHSGQARSSHHDTSLPSKLPRSAPSRDHPHSTHSPEELKDFMIPALTVENAPVEESLGALIERYNEICHDTGESPLTFNYRIEGQAAAPLDLHLKQVSFLRALRIIAARYELVLKRSGTKLVFSSPKLAPAESLLTSQRPVPPTFLTDLSAFFVSAPAAPEDPFTRADPIDTSNPGRSSGDSAPSDSLSRLSLIDQLRNLGIVHSTNAAVSYLPGSSTLVLKASSADQARLASFLEDEFLNTRPVMLRTTTKVVETQDPVTFDDTRFSDEEFQRVMRSLAQTKGADIMTQPSVTSRPGQSATVEIIREVIFPDPDNAERFDKDWTGVRMQIDSGGYGFDLESNVVHEVRNALGDTPDTIKGVTASGSRNHPSGNTVLIESRSPTGAPLYLFVTTQRIDATGRPYDPRNPGE